MTISSTQNNIFKELATGAHKQSYVPRTLEAQQYYRRKAAPLKTLTPLKIARTTDADKLLVRIPNNASVIGHMILFQYSPKHKQTLPYYDEHPLVFIVKPLPDGFLGINFHYLPYKWRAILLARLSEISTNKSFDETTRIRMTYALLNKTARFRAFRPCLKRYLFSHVRSKFIWIPAYDWEIAIFLPVQKFVKETNQSVWNKSMGSIR